MDTNFFININKSSSSIIMKHSEILKQFIKELSAKRDLFQKPYDGGVDKSSNVIYQALNEAIAFIENDLVASGDLVIGRHFCPACEEEVEFTASVLPYCDWCCATISKKMIEDRRQKADPDWTPSIIRYRTQIPLTEADAEF